MKLSTKGRYAVMAMADLARHTGEGKIRPVPLAEIAQRQEISLSLSGAALRQAAGAAAWSSAARGPGGGYRLAQPATELRIADIILAVDEPIKATRCRADSAKGCLGRTGRCLTHDLWEELGRQIEVFLASVTLADVLEHACARPARPLERADAASDEPHRQTGMTTMHYLDHNATSPLRPRRPGSDAGRARSGRQRVLGPWAGTRRARDASTMRASRSRGLSGARPILGDLHQRRQRSELPRAQAARSPARWRRKTASSRDCSSPPSNMKACARPPLCSRRPFPG